MSFAICKAPHLKLKLRIGNMDTTKIHKYIEEEVFPHKKRSDGPFH